MRKKFVLVISVLFIFGKIFSQGAAFQWAKKIGGAGYESGHAMALDAAGNMYITGQFNLTADFDPGPGTFTMTGTIGSDAYVVKLDAAGNFLWAKMFGGPGSMGSEYGQAICLDATGNIYVAGAFTGGLPDFDPGPGTFTLATFGQQDMFVMKLDALGNLIWVKQMGGVNNFETPYGITVDGLGNVYSTGDFQGTIDFDPSPVVYNLTPAGANDIWLSKLNSSGNFVWAKQLGGINSDIGRSITADGANNIFISGFFSDGPDFDPGPGTTTLTSNGLRDAYICKLDPAGNLIWARNVGGPWGDGAYGTTLDASGNVLTVGAFDNTADLDPGPGTFTIATMGGNDIFISKLNSSGNFVWAKRIGGTLGELGFSIATDVLDNVYTTGYFPGTTDFDPGLGTYTLTTLGGNDIFVHKLDALGNFVWVKRMGGTGNDWGNSVAVDGSGNILSTGYFNVSGDFDPGPATFSLTSSGSADAYIHKLMPCSSVTTNVVGQTNVLCNGNSNGSATISAIGGSGFTYTWFPIGGNTVSASGLASNIYSCVVTNTCGSTNTQTVMITQPPALTLSAIANGSLVCSGNASTLTATGSGGTGVITYTWVSGPSNSISVVNPTVNSIYTVNITDANSCPRTQTVSVNISPNPTITVNSGSICLGNSFTMVPGGANTYTFQGGSAVVSPLSNTSYTVVGTNSVGCISLGFATSNVTVNANPTITVNSGSICSGNSFTIIPSGANSYIYQGGSSVVSPTTNASYTVIGTSTAGCVSVASATSNITVSASPTITVNSGSICNGQSFTIVPSGANTYTIQGGSAVKSPTTTTSYTVIGTNTSGCVSISSATSNITVSNNPTITVNSGSICSGQSFTMIPGGASTYTFQGGSAVVSPIINSSYTVAGTSTAGCVSIGFATSNVTVNTNPTITVNSGSICSGNSFTMIPSGANTYTYQGGGAVVSPIINSSYTVTGTSTAGCVSQGFATSNITVSASPTITVNSGSICSGQSFTIIPSGANTYTIQGGGAIKTPTITTGYTVTGTSTAGCVSISSATSNVTVSASPTITVNSGSICSGQSFTMIPGGASTYTFQGGSAVVSPIINSSYTVAGTSTAGCVSQGFATSNVTVNANPTITVNSGSICSGNSFTMIPSGANTYTYQGGSPVVSPIINSSYTVTGTSTAGCVSQGFATTNITVSASPTITVNSGSICSGQSFTMIPSGANTYTFQGGSAVVSPIINSSYTVTGTSTAGCISQVFSTSSVTVSSIPAMPNAIAGPTALCTGAPATTYSINPVVGATSYVWTLPVGWSGASSTTSISTNPGINGGIISVYASNACGNSSPQTLSVIINPVPSLTVNGNPLSICASENVTLSAGGATSYSWSSGALTASTIVNPIATIIYTVIGSSAGCSSFSTITIGVFPNPTVSTVSNSTLLCVGQSATLSANGANSYTWNPGGTGNSIVINPTVTTSYTLTGTNANGCTNTAVFTQSVDACTGLFVATSVKEDFENVYPNPFTNKIIIVRSTEIKAQLQIFNAIGSLIYRTEIIEAKAEIDLSNYGSGIYFLRVGSTNIKIIKQN